MFYLYFKTKNNFTGRLLMKSHIWISMEKLILQKRSYTVAIGCPILQMIWSCCQRYREITLIRKLLLKLHRLNFLRLLSRMLILTYCVIRVLLFIFISLSTSFIISLQKLIQNHAKHLKWSSQLSALTSSENAWALFHGYCLS